MKKRILITILIIFFIIVLFIFIKLIKTQEIPVDFVKCLGEKSVLYVQLGCHACETQEKAFGKNYKYLTKVDCFFESEKCQGITYTPTWVINGERYVGVQSEERLKELTGC